MEGDEALNWIAGICLAAALVLNGTPMRPHFAQLSLHMPVSLHMPESRERVGDPQVIAIWCAEDPTSCIDPAIGR